jgi:acetyl-CoA synthetase/medium-chain acyl-CoA synthetase
MLGLIRLGAIPIPSTTLLTAKDILFRIKSAEPVGMITDEEGVQKIEEIEGFFRMMKYRVLVSGAKEGWVDYKTVEDSPPFSGEVTKSEDPCLIYFTSGTVGQPKMVLHTHASYPIGHTITGKYWLQLKTSDLHWNLSELGWAKAAWSNLFAPWTMGAAVFIQDTRGKFNPLETLSMLHAYPITTFCASPTAYRMMALKEPIAYINAHPPKTLRHCTGAGEPLNPEVIKIWEKATGLIIRDGYGQTETVLLCGNFPSFEAKLGSMGKPSPGFDLSIVDDDGMELPPHAEGDIAVRIKPERPLWMFKEYWNNPEATNACNRGNWYITGDRGYKDEEGYFWFIGRADDVIISGGYRIGPFEVESALKEHPAVAESAVVAAPDIVRGEIVKAYITLSPGYVPSPNLILELQEHVKKVTAPYKYPRKIAFVDTLPKTISGKIRRVELRADAKQTQ